MIVLAAHTIINYCVQREGNTQTHQGECGKVRNYFHAQEFSDHKHLCHRGPISNVPTLTVIVPYFNICDYVKTPESILRYFRKFI